jgi:hypothetical protein
LEGVRVIKRLFWLGAGIAVGVLVVRKVNQTMHAVSPSGLAGNARESAVGFLDTVRDFVADVKDGMAQREAEINAAFEQGVMIDDWDRMDADRAGDRDHGRPGMID